MRKIQAFILAVLLMGACQPNQKSGGGEGQKLDRQAGLSLEMAEHLAELPLTCIQTEYPNKPQTYLNSVEDLQENRTAHPAFYGCFDWHSAVHGHWSLVKLLKEYPELSIADSIKTVLASTMSRENIAVELAYFNKTYNKTFERTYGWAWLLKLAQEVQSWDDPLAGELTVNLQPLVDKVVENYLMFLPNLRYPNRVGTHTNTAFGLCFAWDYAEANDLDSLKSSIADRARFFFANDEGCPIGWEPSGYDFLSPCLEELDLMRRVLPKDEFMSWAKKFMPQLFRTNFELEPAEVLDRTDGHLVHLDGLNYSRAWVLYGLANQYNEFEHLRTVASQHLNHSLSSLKDGNYEGEHWLGTFALYALSQVE